jgi:hypothetical protein
MQPVEGAVETDRLRALTLYGVLDTARDKTFDRIARMAARCFAAPMATVSIVDTDRIWFKAAYGLHGVKQIGRDPGLCASAILDDVPYLVCDALADPRASNNPLVYGTLGIRFYADAPIVTADGHRLGTVDVLDTRPHQPTDDQVAMLADLAATVMDQLELRRAAAPPTPPRTNATQHGQIATLPNATEMPLNLTETPPNAAALPPNSAATPPNRSGTPSRNTPPFCSGLCFPRRFRTSLDLALLRIIIRRRVGRSAAISTMSSPSNPGGGLSSSVMSKVTVPLLRRSPR